MEKVTFGSQLGFKWWIGALLTALWMPLDAQMLPRLPGEVLAQIAPSGSGSRVAARWDLEHPEWPLEETALCSDMLHVWRFKLAAPNRHHDQDLLKWLNRLPEVQAAQFNLLLESRNTAILPNDSLFDEQWHLFNHGQTGGLSGADLGVDAAWNITTGGLTPHGDTVVVAVIDGGVGLAHPDLVPNLWVNWADVPGDLVDNDLNGYIDDHLGWNVHQKNDQINMPPVQHGSQVSGVLAAKGNNAAGVSGVAWQLRMMFVAGTGTVASLLESFDYVRLARKRYNDTNGQQGAFVVAINCSWGINYGQAADAPLWCAAFDALGEEGILSVAPAANNPVNIDSVGDLPGACNSAYLTMVTSLDQHDNKAPTASWGARQVDLGAYGQSIRTTGGSGYSTASGTSMASPQVAGALGLLYSAPCSTLIRQAVADPAAAALWARHQVLHSAQPTADLSGMVATNGRLHAGHLLEMYEAGCASCPMPFDLTGIPLPNALFLRWTSLPAYDSVEVLWRQVGTLNWQAQRTDTDFLLLSGLAPCSGYELTLRALCAEGGWSDTTDAVVFLTDGCCVAPTQIGVETQNPDFVQVHWTPVFAASGYRVRWKTEGGVWQSIETPDTSL
ncbi:MAG: S8 family serine peptidase, partial [Saprospiraceae bacterium]